MSSYINHYLMVGAGRGKFIKLCTHSWEQQAHRALIWRHGEERADAIISGRDQSATGDLDSWNNLGMARPKPEHIQNIAVDYPQPIRTVIA